MGTTPTQFRPKHSGSAGDDRLYSPHRDIAWIYVPMLRAAIAGLDKASWEEWYGDYLWATGTTEESLAEGVKRFCEAHRMFTGTPNIEGPVDALELTGFYELPYPVQITFYARLGMVLTGTFFMAVRDVTTYGEAPPQKVELDQMIVEGAKVAQRLTEDVVRRKLTPPNFPAASVVPYIGRQQAIKRELKRWKTEAEAGRGLIQQVEDRSLALDRSLKSLATMPLWTLVWRKLRGTLVS